MGACVSTLTGSVTAFLSVLTARMRKTAATPARGGVSTVCMANTRHERVEGGGEKGGSSQFKRTMCYAYCHINLLCIDLILILKVGRLCHTQLAFCSRACSVICILDCMPEKG